MGKVLISQVSVCPHLGVPHPAQWGSGTPSSPMGSYPIQLDWRGGGAFTSISGWRVLHIRMRVPPFSPTGGSTPISGRGTPSLDRGYPGLDGVPSVRLNEAPPMRLDGLHTSPDTPTPPRQSTIVAVCLLC